MFERQNDVNGNYSSTTRRTVNAKPKQKTATDNKPKGHEAFLKTLEDANATIFIQELDTNEIHTGTIKRSDKYTISLSVSALGGYQVYVFYKHAIKKFWTTPTKNKPSAE